MRLSEYDDISEFVAVAFVVIFAMVVWATVAEQRLAAFTRDPAAARAQTVARRTAIRATLRTLLAQSRPPKQLLTVPWLVCAAGLTALTVAVLTGATAALDARALPWFTTLGAGGVGHVTARVLVMGGQFWLVGTLATALAVWRGIQARTARPVLVTGAAMLLMSVALLLMKVLVGRTPPRAGESTVLDGGLSYPSGHAATAAVCLVLAVALITGPHHANRRRSLVAAGTAAGVVGVCTAVLGYHWITDVAGGWAAGALIAIPAVRWLDCPAREPPLLDAAPGQDLGA